MQTTAESKKSLKGLKKYATVQVRVKHLRQLYRLRQPLEEVLSAFWPSLVRPKPMGPTMERPMAGYRC